VIHLYLTGASRGIGAGIAKACRAHADVHCDGFSRSGLGLDEAPNYRDHCLDLSELSDLEQFRFPEPHPQAKLLVLVNNAGTLGPLDRVGRHEAEAVDRAVRLNLTAPMLLSNAMVRQFEGHPASKLIVHISSGAAQSPYAGWSVYCATKAGLDMLARVQDMEFAGAAPPAKASVSAASDAEPDAAPVAQGGPFFVRSMAPGVVETDMQSVLRNAEPKAFPRKDKFVSLHREGQLSDAEAVGRAYVDRFRAFAAQGPQAIPELISRLPPLHA
jgi:NAD(P)-dependent dehydrogenase (short-subunit alcohol dehydrogenase family)